MEKVLIIVDAQNDFISGSLPVPDAAHIVRKIAEILPNYDRVIFTMDWHPMNHCSFDTNGGSWPIHCLQGDYGSTLHLLLTDTCIKHKINYEVYLKGNNPAIEEYGAFGSMTGYENPIGFINYVDKQIQLNSNAEYSICGFAGDYCVKYTMENLQKLGLDVTLIKECTGYIGNA